MLKKILVVIAVLIAGVLVYAAMQPETFHIERSAEIKAPPEKIFAVLNDFQQSPNWSPYEKKDPAMKRSFSGPTTGKGSVYAFDGNDEVGAGRIEIVESVPSRKIALRLDFVRPFEGSSTVEYKLEPKGGATKVTWAMDGKSPFVARLMCLFLSIDKMVGKDFETGLANLKAYVEKS